MTVAVLTPAVAAVHPETLIIIVHPIQAVTAAAQEILNVAAAAVVALTVVVHRHLTTVVPLIPAVTARVSMCLSAIPAAAATTKTFILN